MKGQLPGSLVFRTGLTLAAIVVLALISIVTSVVVADRMQGDAEAINTAGSLRWQSYRIGVLIHAPRAVLDESILNFETRMASPALARAIAGSSSDSLVAAWQTVTGRWSRNMKPLLVADPVAADAYLANISDFVRDVDQFAQELQKASEDKVQTLLIVQGITMFLTLAVVFAAMFALQAEVLSPLYALINVAKATGRGDFTMRVEHIADDELGVLGQSFNTMAEDLSRLYSDMENRVRTKTAELQRNNDALDMLYRVSRLLVEPGMVRARLPQVLSMIATATHTRPVFYGNAIDGSDNMMQVVTPQGEFSADRASVPATSAVMPQAPDNTRHTAAFPVESHQSRFGLLSVEAEESSLDASTEQILRSVADVLATAFSLSEREQDMRRLLLMEERAVIARELHDSLAQSLSYQKIQVSRLDTLLVRGAPQEQIMTALDDLRDGLNSAYRQLRELLTTFRLRIEGRGFGIAVNAAVEEFTARGIDIRLDFRIAHCALAANEEIHALQVVREALSNVVRHAQATSALVSLRQRADGRVEVVIEDDGIGMPAQTEKRQHHGLVIIRERATTLGGHVIWEPVQPHGTRVTLVFRPAYLNA